jgi:hypothetical protein
MIDFLVDDCDDAERTARLRELRVLCALYAGWNSAAKLACDDALIGGSITDVLAEIDRLPARTRRRVLASFGALVF